LPTFILGITVDDDVDVDDYGITGITGTVEVVVVVVGDKVTDLCFKIATIISARIAIRIKRIMHNINLSVITVFPKYRT
jgi:uncharacterized membrane protein